ncbi:MAG: cation transporter [Deltaproteobacteria bacterium]|nr:cation transporter [Deltaproteobacteria bacterium]
MDSSVRHNEILPRCHWCAAHVGDVALWGNVFLFAVKLLCGSEGDSRAVMADAAHSAADVLLALILMLCLRISKVPPDEEHPYGRGSIEYIASLFVGISLTSVAGLIVYTSIADIASGVEHQPTMMATLGLIISIMGNELMFRHSLCCGARFGSPAMIANAWENRADVYSSLAALLGVVGAQMGLLFMDPLGAIVVAILLLHSAFQMTRSAWRGILDHSLDVSMESRIRKLALSEKGVLGLASLQTRAIGQYLGIDLTLEVSPRISLGEGCEICDRVKSILRDRLEKTALITVSTVGKDVGDD